MWTQKPRLGAVAAYAPMETGWEEAPKRIAEARAALAALPVDLTVFDEPVGDLSSVLRAADRLRTAGIEGIVWLAATWAFDSLALEFLRVCPAPLAAWGVPHMETGSVCGSQQLIQVLTELRHPRAFVHAAAADPAVHGAILDFAQAAAAWQRLKRARFGMLGHRTVGMTEVVFHGLDLMRRFGSMVYYMDADRLRSLMGEVAAADAAAAWARVKARCGNCAVSEADGTAAARCYLAMRKWAERDGLHGIAVGCYPDLMGTACLGCGLLAEEGIVTSCEGDMNSVVMTAVMHLMSGRPVHNTDFLTADLTDNTCTFSHCGNSAICLAADEADVALEHVRLMDQGVVTRYPGAPGRVTLANLCGTKDTYRMTYYTGEAVPTEMTFPGIPVKVRLDVPAAQFLRDTAAFGAGHHWMIAYGDLSKPLAAFAEFAGLKTLSGAKNQ